MYTFFATKNELLLYILLHLALFIGSTFCLLTSCVTACCSIFKVSLLGIELKLDNNRLLWGAVPFVTLRGRRSQGSACLCSYIGNDDT